MGRVVKISYAMEPAVAEKVKKISKQMGISASALVNMTMKLSLSMKIEDESVTTVMRAVTNELKKIWKSKEKAP